MRLELVAQRELHYARIGQQAGVVPEGTLCVDRWSDRLNVESNRVRYVKYFPSEGYTLMFRPRHCPALGQAQVYAKETVAPDIVAGSRFACEIRAEQVHRVGSLRKYTHGSVGKFGLFRSNRSVHGHCFSAQLPVCWPLRSIEHIQRKPR